ncbi:hypothetical protein IGI04_005919 [Brassica rapa subsp. trilocularis]|uniref:Uncharacterized protein n=1 Tax=Brassica rapa subsp. trilocularis TaxID=1813537 RepID=A0ABQ7NHR2_BRACM|nr:hypothetical protein IGI04_005919 [Brassica rapa subsp. trilocularis]
MATGRLRKPDAIWRPAGYIWRQVGYTTWLPYGDRSATQPGRTPYGDRPVTYGDRSATQPSRHMATGPLLDWVTMWQSVRCETGSPYDDQLVIRLGRHMATGLSQTRIVKRRPRRYKLMHSRLILVFSPLQTKTVLSLIPLRLELSLKFYDKNLEDLFLSYKFRSLLLNRHHIGVNFLKKSLKRIKSKDGPTKSKTRLKTHLRFYMGMSPWIL